ncbi:P-loop containing nucleoside triphosphate hydrolase protein [Nemania sp. FL0916]|nr:P-loop containing nucleoside triphosphate hydrolase protein [Nemania sp. FL0916]
MDTSQKAQTNLFDVYLRLRPPQASNANAEKFLLVEEPEEGDAPTHITLNPPNDRRRAIEKFAFTRVFEEDATQLDLFQGTKVLPLVEGALAPHGGDGTDGLLATLGMTGSGKTHTMLGCRSQRGLTQMALDVLFRSIESNIIDYYDAPASFDASIRASDASEANIYPASAFLESMFGDATAPSRAASRAGTPMIVRPSHPTPHLQVPGQFPDSPKSVRLVRHIDELYRVTVLSTPPSQRPQGIETLMTPVASYKSKLSKLTTPSPSKMKKHYMALTSAAQSKNNATKQTFQKGDCFSPPAIPRRPLQRPSALPQIPDISAVRASCDPSAEYAIVISMYEVYNDRIFDLLTPPVKLNATKEYRRRALLFKCTETSPDRKVVAGLRKVICNTLQEALMVLEAGLQERRVAGTGSNSVSSRSHGFFCIEIKKRRRGRTNGPWGTSTLSIVDLAGSERARDAKTQGATLVEGGKINESLMYLGQCLQMQTDLNNNAKVLFKGVGPGSGANILQQPNLRLFRQCKLTELLFTNSFPSATASHSPVDRRAPQKAVMIVTADPLGDFNATSQILRYSALAREVTVPRIPSITSTILSHGNNNVISHAAQQQQQPESRPVSSSLSSSPPEPRRPAYQPQQPSGTHSRTFSPVSDTERSTMENAALEIARMADLIDQLHAELAQESEARVAAEAHLMATEDRIEEAEQEVREECYADFEQRLSLEMNRYKASLSLEQERGEAHWDRKVEVLARSVGVIVTAPSGDEDDYDLENEDNKENVLIENLEQENDRLRREVTILKRELSNRTPSRRAPLQERGDVLPSMKGGDTIASLGGKMEQLRVSNGSPVKNVRKLPAKKWENTAVDDDLF